MSSPINLIGLPGDKSKLRKAKTAAERQRERYGRMTPDERRNRETAKRTTSNLHRRFIGWDGEGVNTRGPGKPQAYVLFGNSTGTYISRSDGHTLSFGDCAEHIIRVGIENPNAWHVGFAFDYDVNQIVRTLPFATLERLNATGQVRYGPYWIGWRKGKSFTLTKTIDGTKRTVTIYDIFSFFATSFVKSVSAILGSDPRYSKQVAEVIGSEGIVGAGKAKRKGFKLDEMDSIIIPYWRKEIELLEVLVTRFRDLLYSAGFPITKWYGPGAIASLVLNRNRVADSMAVPPAPVIEAAQYAYAGGRFERFRAGRYKGPVWGIDLNSAYPDALTKLPILAGGTWSYRSIGKSLSEIPRSEIKSFAIYRIELSHPQWRLPGYPLTPPSPLFFRTPQGEMRYPWHVNGWYWGPEVENLCHKDIAPYAKAIGVWEFAPASTVKPFAFIADMYAQRQEWKKAGKSEQLALKLAMNSIYGKLAQRVGWEQRKAAPTFHQLEWAGWITSYVRATLFRALWELGHDIISVETDGIYTTKDPASIGIGDSSKLGEWGITRYDEILYLQSGTYFARSGNEWTSKYRGLDPQSLPRESAESYLQGIVPGATWSSITGTTTRYIGLAAAMIQSRGNAGLFRGRHGVWDQDKDKDINPGGGKRSHYVDSCVECTKGISPYDYPHYFGITLDLLPSGINESTKHYLPWRDGPNRDFAWRDEAKLEEAKLFE